MKQTFDSFKTNNKKYNINDNNNDTNKIDLFDKIVHTLNLPYKSNHDINLIKSIKTSGKKTLPEKYDIRIILTGTKLSSQLNIKVGTI